MPTFHNPGGVTLSAERRVRLAGLARRYNFFIIEDDAYMELNFTDEQLPTLYSLCPQRVIYLNTFSKIIAPGIRLGWAVAQKEVIQKMKLLMLGGSTGVFTQEILASLLERLDIEDHLGKLKNHYKHNRDIMAAAIHRYFGSDVEFHLPQGGFFSSGWPLMRALIRLNSCSWQRTRASALWMAGAFTSARKVFITPVYASAIAMRSKSGAGSRRLPKPTMNGNPAKSRLADSGHAAFTGKRSG